MSIKRNILESCIYCVSRIYDCFSKKPKSLNSFFILRNNGIGDLLCTTPLFEALKINYPTAKVYVGIGDWHQDILDGNPYIDQIIRINAPWHNQFTGALSIIKIIRYLFLSAEVKRITQLKISCGIDVLGSQWGSLLLIKGKVKTRLGVKGYAGGHAGCEKFIHFDPQTHAGIASLKFLNELPNKNLSLPNHKPKIYLTEEEKGFAKKQWQKESFKILIAPGGSFNEKCWPVEYFLILAEEIIKQKSFQLIIVGGPEDEKICKQICDKVKRCKNLCNRTTLRESFSIVATSDLLISNSSVLMHVAGAFETKNLVLLGNWYDSANLHQKQWGYNNSKIIGKESYENIFDLCSPMEAMEMVRKFHLLTTSAKYK